MVGKYSIEIASWCRHFKLTAPLMFHYCPSFIQPPPLCRANETIPFLHAKYRFKNYPGLASI